MVLNALAKCFDDDDWICIRTCPRRILIQSPKDVSERFWYVYLFEIYKVKMKRYETIRVTPLDICLEANFVTSLPLDKSSVTVQDYEPVTDDQGNEYFDTDFEMY